MKHVFVGSWVWDEDRFLRERCGGMNIITVDILPYNTVRYARDLNTKEMCVGYVGYISRGLPKPSHRITPRKQEDTRMQMAYKLSVHTCRTAGTEAARLRLMHDHAQVAVARALHTGVFAHNKSGNSK